MPRPYGVARPFAQLTPPSVERQPAKGGVPGGVLMMELDELDEELEELLELLASDELLELALDAVLLNAALLEACALELAAPVPYMRTGDSVPAGALPVVPLV
jgi:hypothetical protein